MNRIKILAIGAHPDDIEYGCGGFLLKAAEKKNRVFLFILTKGEKGGAPHIRVKEQEKSAKFLKAEKIFWGDLPDTKLRGTEVLIPSIEKIINLVNPDEVYVNYYEDTHQDHRALCEAVVASTRYIKKVFFYEDYTTMNFHPTFFVDIESVLDKKIKLLKYHYSQVTRRYPTRLDILESVKAIANYRGFQGKVKYAEGFKILRYFREV